MLGLPSLGGISGWGRAVAEEIGRLPSTLHDARALLADLPVRLDALVDALNTTTAALERVLPELERSMATVSRRIEHVDGMATEVVAELERTTTALERILGDVSGVIGGMDGRLQNLDSTVAELGRVAVTLIEGIPGVRRVLRRRAQPS